MKITNINKINRFLDHVLTTDNYDHNDIPNPENKPVFSVTQLTKPSMVAKLQMLHGDKAVVDISDRVAIMIGNAVHEYIYFRLNEMGIEDFDQNLRLNHDFGHFILTGELDLIDYATNTIFDWKTDSVWSMIFDKGVKPDYVMQLNMYRLLAVRNGHTVDNLKNSFLFKDHSKGKAAVDNSYPRYAVQDVDISILPEDEVLNFIFKKAAVLMANLSDIPECTPEEKWNRDRRFAIMIGDRKKAEKLFFNEEDAQAYLLLLPDDLRCKARVDERRCRNPRCEQYCALNTFCRAYRRDYGLDLAVKNGVIAEDGDTIIDR